LDSLLRGEKLAFSIDNIAPLFDKPNVFSALIIPDFDSKYFPPFHLRRVNVKAELLEKSFYYATTRGLPENQNRFDFRNSVKQGGYYVVKSSILRELKAFEKEIIGPEQDFFAHSLKLDNPYNETNLRGKNSLTSEEGYARLSNREQRARGKMYLYCFYCGQGDSLLLITSNGNAYLIDINLYNDAMVDQYLYNVQNILRSHNLPEDSIKGLIITHKHLDHLRGAKQVIERGRLNIESLIINLDYVHSTQCVHGFLSIASQRIPIWINANNPGVIHDGRTRICIKNPDNSTATNTASPDINDSSIALCIRFGMNLLYLTGDAHAEILETKFSCGGVDCQEQSMLKVSHHGSRTGTNVSLLNMFRPRYAFISAGDSRIYNHPHAITRNLISSQQPPVDQIVSKQIRRTVLYEVDGYTIRKRII
jgi:beta-lactamase superfamily II metal-dependent hydrolase